MPEQQQPSGDTGVSPSKNTLMAVLAYVGPLVIVSFLIAKDDPFVKFHIKQGLTLFIIEVALWFLMPLFFALWMIIQLINLGVFVLAIVGIMNAVNGNEKELPLVGQFSKHIPL